MQKIFPLHCKISLTTYTRTVRFCLLQIQFFRVFNTQNLPVLLTLETVCRTPVQPLSSVSGHKRYNTLDFASKIVCQQGCCSPLLETQSQRSYAPLDTPLCSCRGHLSHLGLLDFSCPNMKPSHRFNSLFILNLCAVSLL